MLRYKNNNNKTKQFKPGVPLPDYEKNLGVRSRRFTLADEIHSDCCGPIVSVPLRDSQTDGRAEFLGDIKKYPRSPTKSDMSDYHRFPPVIIYP